MRLFNIAEPRSATEAHHEQQSEEQSSRAVVLVRAVALILGPEPAGGRAAGVDRIASAHYLRSETIGPKFIFFPGRTALAQTTDPAEPALGVPQ